MSSPRGCSSRVEQLRRVEHLDPRGGELDREREAVEAAADLGDRLGGLEAGCHLSRAGDEELDRLLLGKRRHRVLVLAAEVERLAARDEDRHLLRLCEQLGQPRRCLDELLEVVEQEQRPLAAQVLGEPVLGAQRLRDRRLDERGVAERRQRHPPDAVGIVLDELGRDLEREPRLARSRPPGQRHQPRPRGELDELGQLALAADERRRR